MTNKDTIGVIMAAGKGTRMEPFSSSLPKPLLPICNRPLIEHQIMIMKNIGVERIIIVVGHLGFEISRKIGSGKHLGVQVRYVEQSECYGIAHAVGKLEPYIDSQFLLFLGDIFFQESTIGIASMLQVAEQDDLSAVLAVINENDPEAIKRNFAVLCNDSGYVKRVIEKPRYVTSRLKGCGLYIFPPHIFDAIRRTPRTAMRDEYELTDSIQILVDDGFPVKTAEVLDSDMNLTFPHDLLQCNLQALRANGDDSLVGKECQLGKSQIHHSIVGDNVVVKNPIRIENSLILSNSIVEIKTDISYCILTPDGVYDCKNALQGDLNNGRS
jgi:NDP-sugar pyrophosphorylase family protein